jgi:hypothetical protein
MERVNDVLLITCCRSPRYVLLLLVLYSCEKVNEGKFTAKASDPSSCDSYGMQV